LRIVLTPTDRSHSSATCSRKAIHRHRDRGMQNDRKLVLARHSQVPIVCTGFAARPLCKQKKCAAWVARTTTTANCLPRDCWARHACGNRDREKSFGKARAMLVRGQISPATLSATEAIAISGGDTGRYRRSAALSGVAPVTHWRSAHTSAHGCHMPGICRAGGRESRLGPQASWQGLSAIEREDYLRRTASLV